MISLLNGIVAEKPIGKAVIMTAGGVGYEVFTSRGADEICIKNETVNLRIKMIVREQELTLYGFASEEEKALFDKLLGVNGIGPRSAMAFLLFPVSETLQHIETGDATALSKTPGVGKKTAQKIILELKGKLTEVEDKTKPKNSKVMKADKATIEAKEALVELGFNPKLVESALGEIKADDAEGLIQEFLRAYAR